MSDGAEIFTNVVPPLSISLGDCSSHPTHPTTNPSRREIECISFLSPYTLTSMCIIYTVYTFPKVLIRRMFYNQELF